MKSSLSELSSKLVASHTQHCEAAAQSEATIRGLNEKHAKASGELAVLRSALEAAALDQERTEEQMKQLQHDLDAKTKDLHTVLEPFLTHASMLDTASCACQRLRSQDSCMTHGSCTHVHIQSLTSVHEHAGTASAGQAD
jgi:chromosome segregation ATPase